MAEQSYAGLAVMVFGAAGALGSGVAAAFAAAGASVAGVDKAEPAAERRLDGVRYSCADVLADETVGALLDSAPAPWAVINTVGGFAPHRPLAESDVGELTGQLMLNLVSAAVITKHALRVMRPAGAGRIVHTASRAGVVSKGSGTSRAATCTSPRRKPAWSTALRCRCEAADQPAGKDPAAASSTA